MAPLTNKLLGFDYSIYKHHKTDVHVVYHNGYFSKVIGNYDKIDFDAVKHEFEYLEGDLNFHVWRFQRIVGEI